MCISEFGHFTNNVLLQETFDAAVKENQDEFGMEVNILAQFACPGAAIAETSMHRLEQGKHPMCFLCSWRKQCRVQWRSSNFRCLLLCMCLPLLARYSTAAHKNNLSLAGCGLKHHCHKPVRRQAKHVSLHLTITMADSLLLLPALHLLSRQV